MTPFTVKPIDSEFFIGHHRPMETNPNSALIGQIEAMARARKISMARFLRAVDVDPGLYHKWKRGDVQASPARIDLIRKLARRIRPMG